MIREKLSYVSRFTHQMKIMDHVKHLKCLICSKEYAPDEIEYICPDHGNEGIVDVVYDYERIGQRISQESLAENPDQTIWRYKPDREIGYSGLNWGSSVLPPMNSVFQNGALEVEKNDRYTSNMPGD